MNIIHHLTSSSNTLKATSCKLDMELELGLKITRDQDDHNSTHFHIAKDPAGPVFVSTETDSVFILSAHLKGFEKENVRININEDGTRLTISGEKLVRETIMKGWRVYNKKEEVRGFRKTFKIPDGVVLDRIRAKFGVGKSSLTIYMPKSEKGIRGHGIEHVKEEGEEESTKSAETRDGDEQVREVDKDEMPPLNEFHEQAQEAEPTAGAQGLQEDKNGKAVPNQLDTPQASVRKEGEEGAVVGKKPGSFAPTIFMGSALIASIVVLVVGLARTKR